MLVLCLSTIDVIVLDYDFNLMLVKIEISGNITRGNDNNMKKVSLAVVLFTVSFGLLLIQFIILQTLIRKDEVDVADPVWEIISEVSTISYKHGVALVLADPVIFRHIQNGSTAGHSDCHVLCLGQKVTRLATIGALSTQLQKTALIEELKYLGYEVFVNSGSDPVLLRHGLNVPIPLHLLFSRKQQIIQVLVLYERPGKFWWIGAFIPSDRLKRDMQRIGLDSEDLALSAKAAALEKVEIVPAAVDNVKTYLPLKPQVFSDYGTKEHFIECNYSRAKQFHETYGRDESDEAEIFRTKAWKLLAKAKSLLDELDVPFWLSSGTCLGFFRECEFIPYSKDLDLGIWIRDYRPEIISMFSTHDLPLTHRFGKVEDSYELSFRDGDIKLDLFFFYEDKDYVWNGGTQARTGKKYKYIFNKFQLCWTEFLELKVRVPCQTEDYIKSNYGDDWFMPVKNWDWKSSPSNVQENGQWPVPEWSEVIQLIPLPEQT